MKPWVELLISILKFPGTQTLFRAYIEVFCKIKYLWQLKWVTCNYVNIFCGSKHSWVYPACHTSRLCTWEPREASQHTATSTYDRTLSTVSVRQDTTVLRQGARVRGWVGGWVQWGEACVCVQKPSSAMRRVRERPTERCVLPLV